VLWNREEFQVQSEFRYAGVLLPHYAPCVRAGSRHTPPTRLRGTCLKLRSQLKRAILTGLGKNFLRSSLRAVSFIWAKCFCFQYVHAMFTFGPLDALMINTGNAGFFRIDQLGTPFQSAFN
jgi:hypothetical protein